MSTSFFTRIIGLSLAMATLSPGADAPPPCHKIAQDVTESVTKDPSKVLMIVEDALVINETCACEIVKAAIVASKADPPMVKQIVDTAVAVAPKMAPIIIECANSVVGGAVAAETVALPSGKDAKNVQPVSVTPPDDSVDYSSSGASIRGVYLMAPAVGGFVATSTDDDKDGDKDDDDDDEEKECECPRDDKPKPMSPSNSSP